MAPNDFDRLKQASVFIRGSNGTIGTGYLVAPDRVATAWHVVSSWEKDESLPVLIGINPRATRKARVVKADDAADAALLELDSAVDHAPLPLATGLDRKAAWDGYGFPKAATTIAQPPGLPIDGHVQDPSTFTDRGAPAVLLYSEIIAAGNASPLHGFSGSPVTVQGAVVGHMVKHIGDPDDKTRASFGYVYACPIDAVAALLGPIPVTKEAIAPDAITTLSDAVPKLPAGDYHVFVSYRSSDRAWAVSLVTRLEGMKLRVFIDQQELEVGEALAKQAQSALERSRAAVILVSKGWIESPRCQQEGSALLDRARKDRDFALVPLRLDDSPMPVLPNAREPIDFTGTPRAEGEGVENLIRDLLKQGTRPADSVAAKADVAERKLTDEFVARIKSAAAGNVATINGLLADWQRTACTDVAPVLAATEVLIGKRAFKRALKVVEGAGNTVRARQLRALALSKDKRDPEAIEELEALEREGNLDPETSGLLAGRYKQIWLATGDNSYMYRSYEKYLEAYERSGDAFNGINATSMALHCGYAGKRSKLAQQVVDLLKDKPRKDLDAWARASLAEGYLLLENFELASEWYASAAAKAAGLPQDIAVMRAQARRNLEAMGRGKNQMDVYLPVPRVLVYMGHMTDAPNRAAARLPPEKIGRLRNEIERRIKQWGVLHGFGTAARGTDIVVLEVLSARRLTATVMLPFARSDFKKTSLGGDWNGQFDELEKNTGFEFIELLDTVPPPDRLTEVLDKTNHEVFERAVAYAADFDEKPLVLAVWDGQSGDGPGGTADAVQLWRNKDYEPEIIDPHTL
jgi:tetratricopeptide (TPR) repeat protein